MFSREFRLPPSVSFVNASSSKHSFFLLKVKPNGLSHNRYGVVISKRVDKRATERNRLRRLFSSLLESWNIKQGYDVLVIVSPQAKDQERDMIELPLQEALATLELL